MKTNKIIIWIVISIILTSCFSENYKIITRVDRDGSCRREIYTLADSINHLLPYDFSSGWDISQRDSIVDEYLSQKSKKYIKVSKKFNSVEELSEGLRQDKIFPTPKESLKKRFRWFYTYYTFTAVYPEVTAKGRVPMDKYLNEAERKLYFQGDMSAYKGMTGMELKEELDGIEARFMKWYSLSVYEESFAVISHYAGVANIGFRPQLPAVKDTLYSINEKQLDEQPENMADICVMLDKYFVTDRFSKLYAENESEMDKMFKENTKATDELLNFSIQYELTLPGKIVATNTDLQNDGVLSWNVNLFRFLANDYTLTAESRTINIWAFAVTLLLVLFTVYCFKKSSK